MKLLKGKECKIDHSIWLWGAKCKCVCNGSFMLLISVRIWLLRSTKPLGWAGVAKCERYIDQRRGKNWHVLGYFLSEVMTEGCAAPEGQISLFSWDLDQFHGSVMMLKDASGSIPWCLSRRRSAVYGCGPLFWVHLQKFCPSEILLWSFFPFQTFPHSFRHKSVSFSGVLLGSLVSKDKIIYTQCCSIMQCF